MTAAEKASDQWIGRELLGTYRIVELLGRGGMSVVYRGRHLVIDQDVAIKILPPDLAGYAEIKARFIAEARTLARLEHPNIVGLYNFVEQEGHLYLVMQYAEGETLDAFISREGRLPVGDVVASGIETLRALEYAHERQVIHRDIKPSNIILRADGAVKVMDFGIAKIVGSTRLTETGQTMGTVRYMSPEQVRGKGIDARTDIYSLGVTLYEACTGRTPFDGDTHFDIMRKHLSEVPRPASELAAVPSQLDEVLMTALQKRPEDRFDGARDFMRALQAVPLTTPSRRVSTLRGIAPVVVCETDVDEGAGPSNRWRGGVRALLAITLLIASALAVAWGVWPDRKSKAVPAAVPNGGGVRDGGGVVRAHWPPVHVVARHLRWAVDRRFEREGLHLLAVHPLDAEAVAAAYLVTHERYQRYLREEGINLTVPLRPLNVALVPNSVFREQQSWASPRYEAPSSTLYIDQDAPDPLDSDLPLGCALHFCAFLPQLSNQRCVELAEGFGVYLQQHLQH